MSANKTVFHQRESFSKTSSSSHKTDSKRRRSHVRKSVFSLAVKFNFNLMKPFFESRQIINVRAQRRLFKFDFFSSSQCTCLTWQPLKGFLKNPTFLNGETKCSHTVGGPYFPPRSTNWPKAGKKEGMNSATIIPEQNWGIILRTPFFSIFSFIKS